MRAAFIMASMVSGSSSTNAWISARTAAGTSLLRQICSKSPSSRPSASEVVSARAVAR